LNGSGKVPDHSNGITCRQILIQLIVQRGQYTLGTCRVVLGCRAQYTCFKITESSCDETFPDQDKELKPDVQVLKSNIVQSDSLRSHRFERFSSWKKLLTTIALLRHTAASCRDSVKCKGWYLCPEARTVKGFQLVE